MENTQKISKKKQKEQKNNNYCPRKLLKIIEFWH